VHLRRCSEGKKLILRNRALKDNYLEFRYSDICTSKEVVYITEMRFLRKIWAELER
jgi:hypothetical protein